MQFLMLLKRHDEKFLLIQRYQEHYNTFLSNNQDLVEDDQTKEELHQRVEDLNEILFDLIEQKKEESLDELKSLKDSLWIETIQDYITSIIF